MAFRNVQDLHRSILDNGGASISLDLEVEPTTGYMVSLHGTERRFSLDIFKRRGVEEILRFLADNFSLLDAAAFDAYLGAWIAEVDGQTLVFLDVSINIQDRERAIVNGRWNRQLAIWDVTHSETITL